ncbi:recombinase family protein [Litchfieldia salsa]|uniref:Site-specific DNA recombinase n=1 Tax=Litchfieldia salsa TaxID=930152 RepID=A0A1H0UCZ7_9BACI|nr:recombinase family protein [Litchfieldia salsa]SDP64182.1 site-specific DNA recombinase [Litchfieldia salsa]
MKVALYVRVSTEEQADEGYSIEGQIKALTEYCHRNNFEIVEKYKDEGISGKSMNRPALNQLLNDCTNKKFNLVLVWKYSRLSRKQKDFLNIIDHLEQHDVKFYSVSEAFDTSTPMGMAMLQIFGTFAELEGNQIVENVKMGMTQRAKEGKFNGGSMLGYKSVNKELVIVKSEAEIVRRIFSMYVDGKGYKAIASKLNHEGYKTKRNKAFSITSVRTIITNPAYAGFIRFNQVTDWSDKRRKGTNKNPIIVKGNHEPIIDIGVWDKAQAILKQKSYKPTKTFTGHFPLTTLLRCPDCGHGMIGHHNKKSKNSNEYIRYYQCGNFHSKGSAICRSNSVRADYAEEYVFKRLEEVTSNPSILKSIVDGVNAKIGTHKEPLRKQLTYTEEQLTLNQKNLNKYFSLFDNDRISADIMQSKIDSLAEERKVLQARLNEIKQQLEQPTIKELSYDKIYHSLKAFSKVLPKVSPEKQKHFLHSIINKIYINPSSNIQGRSIKDIELFFDTSLKNHNHVLTYGTVPPD